MNVTASQHMHNHTRAHLSAAVPFDGHAVPYDPRASEAAPALSYIAGGQQHQYANINAGQCRVEGVKEIRPEEETGQAKTHRNGSNDYPKLVVVNERPQSHDGGHQSPDRVAQSDTVVFTRSNCAFFAALFLLSFSVVLQWEFIMGLFDGLF